jgi:site-specific recombinase XerD
MALIEEQQQADKEQEIHFEFIDSLKSPVTKETYDINIKKYLKFCNFTKLSELLTIQEPQKQIIKYITSLKERGLSTRSIHTMLYAIYHFYVMNDVILNRVKINKFIGEPTLKTVDRPYRYEEIQKILNVSDQCWQVVKLS